MADDATVTVTAAPKRNRGNDYRLPLPLALQQVPLTALNERMRLILSEALNKPTVTLSNQSYTRNFKGLAELIGFQYSEIQTASNSVNPTGYVITEWIAQGGSSIGRLIEHLKRMERFDVLDDLQPILLKNSSIGFMPYISPLEVESAETLEEKNRARNFGLDYFSRVDWGAHCPLQTSQLAVSPVKIVFIHNTVWYHPDSIFALRILQALKIIHYGHNDVPYSFLISKDGGIFEGRGWDLGGSHTLTYNYVALSFAMLGNYDEHNVTEAMIESTRKLFDYGVAIVMTCNSSSQSLVVLGGKIDPDYSIYAHCDASETLSPGRFMLAALSQFPKFRVFGPLQPSDTFLPSVEV